MYIFFFLITPSLLLFLTVLLDKLWKTSKLFKFLLDHLSLQRYQSIISWEGADGEFVIRRPDQVALLWGERNCRPNMTYQKFSRAMRYYYHKKVLTKIRGRKYAYKFNFKELEVQYGYYRSKPYPASKSHTESYAIPSSYDAFHYSDSINNFPAAMGFISNSSYGYPATMEFASNGRYEIPVNTHGFQFFKNDVRFQNAEM